MTGVNMYYKKEFRTICEERSFPMPRHHKKVIICVVLLCLVSILLMDVYITGVYLVPSRRMFAYYENKKDTYLQTSQFSNNILHSWKENDKSDIKIYIFSAIGYNETRPEGYKSAIRLSGWGPKSVTSKHIKCCISLHNDKTIEYKYPKRVNGKSYLAMSAYQYVCRSGTPIEVVKGVTVQSTKSACPVKNNLYITPYIREEANDKDSFAICLKIVYSPVDNEALRTWLDYNRAIGINKIFTFTYNITKETRYLLGNYSRIGFVESQPFIYPTLHQPRYVGEKKAIVWEDEQVAVLDCLQRLAGHKYMAIVDLDEYLVLRKHDNVHSMMSYMMKKYPLAGGFALSSYIYDKRTKPYPNTTDDSPDFLRYVNRTEAIIGPQSRNKNIVLPLRTLAIGYNTHRFLPQPEYTDVVMDTDIANINHYRECYEDMEELCDHQNLITDTYLRDFVLRRLKSNLHIN